MRCIISRESKSKTLICDIPVSANIVAKHQLYAEYVVD